MPKTDIVVRMAGTAGEGALLMGDILGQALAKLGWDLLLYFSFEAEVRGEKPSFSQIRVSQSPPHSQGEAVDILLGLNRNALELNIPYLATDGFAIYDGRPMDIFRGEELYEPPLPEGVRRSSVPLEVISQRDLGFPAAKNIIALGALCKFLGVPPDIMKYLLEGRFSKKGESVVSTNLKAFDIGHDHIFGFAPPFSLGKKGDPKLFVSGNRASAIGAMAGGCGFFAGYPITPATEVMEYLAKDLPGLGGTVIQAEDEISALGMVLGASFAGKRAMTATSGPGLSLMSEMLGLSWVAEVPAIVLDVQRGGPSTGLPTRPEQSDLDLALHGGHGDVGRIVLAPTNVEECFHAVRSSFGLAEKYQMPVLVLTDQYIGYRRESLDSLKAEEAVQDGRLKPSVQELINYKRYQVTENGISPLSVPGEEGGFFVATGLEHTEEGLPNYDAEIHRAMSAKRFRKLDSARAEKWFSRFGASDAEVGVLAWGSVVGAAMEAVEMACTEGIKVAGFYTVFMSPLPDEEMRGFIGSVRRIIIPELNHTGQFARLVRERFLVEPVSLALTLGGPITAGRILEAIRGGSI